MMKSAFLVLTGALMLTASTAQAQYGRGRCDEYGCDVNERDGYSWRRPLSKGAYDYDWRLSRRDDRYCIDGQCDINGRCGIDGRCPDGRCCEDGRCCIDGNCDRNGCRCENGFCGTADHYRGRGCEDGRCDVDSRYSGDRGRMFPYAAESGSGRHGSRRLEDPFRPASYRDDFDYRRPTPIPTGFEPTSYERRRPMNRSIDWQTSLRRAVDQASRDNLPILVQVTAPWCPHCQQMKEQSWTNGRLTSLVNERYVAVEVNADDQREFINRMGITSLPTTLVVAPDLQIIDRLQGFQSADQLLQTLSR